MRIVTFFGKLLISLGLGVLLFIAWTLWGTGLYTASQQDALDRAFAASPPVSAEATEMRSGGRSLEVVEVAERFTPRPGAPAFRIQIPRIDVDEMVVEGVEAEHLRKGPGHYPACSDRFGPPYCLDGVESFWPGEAGRVIVSGHRTTYGAPFYDLDQLRPGDEIVTETKWGTFTYVVTEQVVVDDNVPVTVAPGDPEIVLTTCNPKYSAAERLLVFARLESSS